MDPKGKIAMKNDKRLNCYLKLSKETISVTLPQ